MKDRDDRRSGRVECRFQSTLESTRSSPSSAATQCRPPAKRWRRLNTQTDDSSSAEELIDAARLLVFLKGNDAHDYKFSSAILEDYYHVSPEWRNKYLALEHVQAAEATVDDNNLVERTRSALQA